MDLIDLINEFKSDIDNIGNAIREKTYKTEKIPFKKMSEELLNISNANDFDQKLIDKTLTNITRDDLQGITQIGDYAFYKCNSLNTVEIPSDIISIGVGAFEGCENLRTIEMFSSVPPTLGDNAFPSNLQQILVEKEDLSIYMLSWSKYSDKIKEK